MAMVVLLVQLLVTTACAQAFDPVRVLRACRLPRLCAPSAAQAGQLGGAPRSTARAGRATGSLTLVRRNTPARSSATALGGRSSRGFLVNPVKWGISIAATAAIGLGVTSIHDWYFSDARRFAASACKANISPQILDESALPYVARAQVDAELGAFVKLPGKFINIVVGPRGAGKTTAVAHALEQTDGVLMLSVTGDHKRDTDIYAALLDSTIGKEPPTAALSQNKMVSLLKATASLYIKKNPGAVDWKPTIVLEVETKAQPATVGLAVQTMKNLVCDRAVCYGFVVLSDAHAVFAIGSDTSRHRYVWLDDFTSAEADVYLDELGVLTAADERALRAEVYATASTRAIDLSKLADELNLSAGKPAREVVRAFIDKKQKDALARVENLIDFAMKAAKVSKGEHGLHFIRLMKAMLKNGGSLPVEDGKYMCSAVGIADVLNMSEHHAISINTQTRVFTFYTPADRAAAEQVLREYDEHDDGHSGKFGPMLSYS